MAEIEIVGDGNIEQIVDKFQRKDKLITIRISNKAIKYINGKINGDEGDDDDPKKVQLDKDVKEDIHQIWRVLNPS